MCNTVKIVDGRLQQSVNLNLWKAFNDCSEPTLRSLLKGGANPDSYGLGMKAHLKKSLLHKAAESGQVNMLQVLLEYKANPDIKDLYQRTPLHYAVENGYEQVVAALLAFKADPLAADEKGVLPLHIADSNEILRMILRNRTVKINSVDKKGRTALHYAISKGKFDIVMTLLENEADPNIKDDDGTTPILEAVKRGDNDIVVALINKGGRVNDEVLYFGSRSSLLHYAVGEKNNDIVKTLLLCGHPVNVYDANGWSAFDAAAVNASIDIVRTMLKCGADPNYKFGEEAKISLHHAVDSEYHPDRAEVVLILIEHGARINETDSNGLTPLDFAVRRGYMDIIWLLLQYKAKITIENNGTAINDLFETAQAVKGYIPPSVRMRRSEKGSVGICEQREIDRNKGRKVMKKEISMLCHSNSQNKKALNEVQHTEEENKRLHRVLQCGCVFFVTVVLLLLFTLFIVTEIFIWNCSNVVFYK